MSMALAMAGVLFAGACVARSDAPAPAPASAPRYTAVTTSGDGIGKRYMAREISGVMNWQGAAWLEARSASARNAPTCR